MKTKSDTFTEQTINLMRGWDEHSAAAAYERRYTDILKTRKELFVEMGLILMEIERRELWRYMSCPTLEEPQFHSMNDWILRGSGTSNGTAHDALECARGLSHISVEERNEMPRCNQKVLAKVSPSVSGRKEVKEKAKKGSLREL